MKKTFKVIITIIKLFAFIFIVDVSIYQFKGKLVQVTYGHEEEYVFYTKLHTVGEILMNLDIELEQFDRINFEDEVLVYDNMEISIDIIRKTTEVLSEVEDFTSSTEISYDVPLFRTEVIVEGQERVIENTFKSVYMNGEVVSRDLIKTEITQDLINEVVGIGRGNAIEFAGTLTGYSVQCNGCTGALYYPSYLGGKKKWLTVDTENIYFNYKTGAIEPTKCASCYYIMAADKKIPGGTIIDLGMPYNSKLGKGTFRAIVLDVGSAIQGKTGDLLFKTDADTFSEGRVRNVTFTIVRWGWWN